MNAEKMRPITLKPPGKRWTAHGGEKRRLRKVSLRRLPSRHQEAFLNLREKTSFIPARATPVLEE